MMRKPVAWIALCFALAGTAVGAASAITGRDIRDGTITSDDVRDRSLRRGDFKRSQGLPRGPQGEPGPVGDVGVPGPPSPGFGPYVPLAFSYVNADGTIRDGFGSRPFDAVAHPSTGVYCVAVADIGWVDVTSASVSGAQRVAAAVDGAGDPPCPASTTVRVTTVAAEDGQPANGPFLLVVERPN